MNATTTTRIPVKSIAISQAEGEIGKMITATVSTWAAAAIILARICSTAPKDGGYYKTDCVAVFADGETYTARFDAAHPESKGYEPADLAAHIRSHVEYLAGYRCPKHLDQATYEHQLAVGEKASPGRGAEARAFLVKYNLKDDPNAKPATIERNDRPRSEPAKILPSTDILARPAHPPVPAPGKPLIPEMLRLIETQLTVALAEMEKEVARRIYLKTTDRANDVASVASAQAKALEIRKALAAVIKARE